MFLRKYKTNNKLTHSHQSMANYVDYSKQELSAQLAQLRQEFERFKLDQLAINADVEVRLTDGNPSV